MLYCKITDLNKMKINLDRNNIFDTANGTESEQSFYDVISELIPVANLQIIFCT